MRFSDLPGRRVAIWGYGSEGRAAATRLESAGVPFTVALPDDEGGDDDRPGIACGPAGLAALRAADVVVKSPGVPVTSPLYRELAQAGITFTNMTDLWLSGNAAQAVGVTGTKGKSTTASLVAHLLGRAGVPVSLRGNIGESLADDPTPGETVVIEVSSYQAQAVTRSPRIAVVTSLFPEHLPWHGSWERYVADKLNLVAHEPEHVVLSGSDTRLVDLVRERLTSGTVVHLTGVEAPDGIAVDAGGGVVWAGVGRLDADDLPLAGRHNAGNIALALLAASVSAPDVAPAALVAGVATFPPLAHRLETIPSADGRRWIDDNLATAPEAVVAALDTWPDEPVALIFGGADRGLDLAPVADYLGARTAPVTLLLIGPAGARFGVEHGTTYGATYGAAASPHRTVACGSLPEAVAWAGSAANTARVVLMSPGAPSFDAYSDYAARAAHLRELVAALR